MSSVAPDNVMPCSTSQLFTCPQSEHTGSFQIVNVFGLVSEMSGVFKGDPA